jgi:translocation and assembly module TamB
LALRSNRGQLSGQVQASLSAGAPWRARLLWQSAQDGSAFAGETRIDGVTERLQVSHALTAPLTAHLHGTVAGLPGGPQWQLALRVAPLPAEPGLWPDTLAGSTAAMTIEGDLASSEVSGDLELPGSMASPVRVAGRIGWQDGAAVLHELGIELPDEARLTLSGRIDPGRDVATEFLLEGFGLAWPLGEAEPALELPTFVLSGRGAGEQWRMALEAHARPAGLAAIDLRCSLGLNAALLSLAPCDLAASGGALRATVSGTLEPLWANSSYRLRLETRIDPVDHPRVDAALVAVGDAAGVEVETLTAELLDGRVDGAGRLVWREGLAADFALTFRDLDPAGIAAEWPGSLSGTLRLEGAAGAPEGFQLRLEGLAGELRSLPVSGAATLDLAADRYRLRGSRVAVGRAFVEAAGELAAGILDLDVALDVPALAALHPDAAGHLTANARITGPRELPTIELAVAGADVRWADHRARELGIAARADLSGARKSRITASLNGYSPGAGAAGDLRFELEGTPARHSIRVDYEQALQDLEIVLAAAGGLSGDRWNGVIDRLALTQGQRDLLALQAPAALSAGLHSARLGDACLDGDVGKLCVAGDWYGGRFWGGRATLDRVDLASISRWLSDGVQAHGSLAGRIELTADRTGFRGATGALRLAAGELRSGNEYAEPLLAWDGGVVDLTGGWNEARAMLDLDLAGSDRLEGYVAVGWNVGDPPLTARLDAELRQIQWLSELVPDLGDLEGRALVQADLSGTLAAPVLTGRFEWREGAAYIPNLGLRPSDIRLVAGLADGVLDLAAQGTSGEGSFRSTGRFDLSATEMAGQAVLQGENLLVAALPEARVIANPDLRLGFSERSISIEGEVLIPFARLTGAGRPAAVGVSRDEVLVGPLVVEERAPELAVTSRVRVIAGEDVRIRLDGLRAGIEGSVLTAIQPDSPPWGRGELRIADGSFNALGQRLDIERGRLMYTGGPLDNPGLEIRTVRRVGEITTGAQVRGTLQQPEVSLFSNPPMAQAEILAYLSFGTSLTDLRTSERGAVNQAAGVLAVSEGGALARDITRRIGLGNADVAVEGGVDGAALVMGRYLGSGLYVAYGLGMFDTVNTLRLRLRINSRLALEATSSDVVTTDLVHTVERD